MLDDLCENMKLRRVQQKIKVHREKALERKCQNLLYRTSTVLLKKNMKIMVGRFLKILYTFSEEYNFRSCFVDLVLSCVDVTIATSALSRVHSRRRNRQQNLVMGNLRSNRPESIQCAIGFGCNRFLWILILFNSKVVVCIPGSKLTWSTKSRRRLTTT